MSKFAYTIKRTPTFGAWLANIKDASTQLRLLPRLRKATLGNLDDVRAVGGGVSEMREHFGPGWCMYYVKRSPILIVMLSGGRQAHA